MHEATEQLPGGRYQMRYGDGWREELKAACAKKHDGLDAITCVTDEMDHIVAESKRAFADTPRTPSALCFERAVITTPHKNPSFSRGCSLRLQTVFRRLRSSAHVRSRKLELSCGPAPPAPPSRGPPPPAPR